MWKVNTPSLSVFTVARPLLINSFIVPSTGHTKDFLNDSNQNITLIFTENPFFQKNNKDWGD